MAGAQARPLRIDVMYAQPADTREHARVLGCPVRFSQACYRVTLPAAALDAPLIQPDPAMRELMRGRTTIVIAHRLSTLSEIDDIAVFDAGRIVEFGARETLVADPGGRFRRLLDLALEPDRAPSEGMLA